MDKEFGVASLWRWIAAAGYIAAAAALVALLLLNSDAAFRIDAQTDFATIAVGNGPAPAFRLEGARVVDADGVELASCSLAITPGAGQRITFVRYGKSPMVLAFDGGARAKFACDGGTPVIDAAQVDAVEAPTLPDARQAALFTGVLTLGDLPRDGGGRFAGLREGVVTMTAASLPVAAGQAINAATLRTGEQLTLHDSAGKLVEGFTTLLLDAEKPGFQVVHQAHARNAKIARYGGSRAETSLLAPSALGRLQANALWAIIPVLLGLLSSGLAQVFARR